MRSPGDTRQGQHACQAGEQATWPLVLVNRLLYRQQQVRRTLDLVNDGGSVQARSNQPGWTLRLEDRLIAECNISSAGPARSYNQDHRGIRKGFFRLTFYEPLKHANSESRSIGTIGIS